MAGLLAACLLPAALVMPQPAAAPAAHAAHAAWLRAQVQGEADAAFENALEAATAAHPRTLHAFLEAFVAAHAEPETLGAVFAREGLSGEALVRDLQQGLLGLSGIPASGRPAWMAGAPHAVAPSGRVGSAGVVASAQRMARAARRAVALPLARGVRARCLVRVLSSAQPLGP